MDKQAALSAARAEDGLRRHEGLLRLAEEAMQDYYCYYYCYYYYDYYYYYYYYY